MDGSLSAPEARRPRPPVRAEERPGPAAGVVAGRGARRAMKVARAPRPRSPRQAPPRSFTDFALASMTPPQDPEIQLVATPEAVDDVRTNCRAIRDALVQRSLINAPTPPHPHTWFTRWEVTDTPPRGSDPWALFVSRSGNQPAEPPPPPL